MRRFPFDEQTCSIQIEFNEYESKEVTWHIDNDDSTFKPVMNPSWTLVHKSIQIVPHEIRHKVGEIVENTTKSLFQFSITLKRQPRTAIVYVILPTLAIAVFNLISLLLPTGEGICMTEKI